MKQIPFLVLMLWCMACVSYGQLSQVTLTPASMQCGTTQSITADFAPCGFDGEVRVRLVNEPPGVTPDIQYITVTGGIGTFSITADPGVTGSFIIKFTVTILDNGNGCATFVTDFIDFNNFTITCPCSLTATAVVDQHETCAGDCDGEATASASSGTPPYTYAWSNGQTSATATGLCPGTYTVTVTDANSCSDTDQVTINPGATVTASVSKNNDESCPGACDGSATASGGVSYLWSNGTTTATANNLCAGSHSVTVTDANGCTDVASVSIITDDTTPPIAVCQNITVSLDGSGNATITAGQVDGGSSDNCGSVTLSINQSSFDCSDIGPNSVTLTATDGAGNTATCVATVTIEDNLAPSITCPANITVSTDPGSCDATNPSIGTATATDNCGTPTITDNAPTTFGLGTTTVTYTADDGNGNTATCTQIVTVEDQVAPTISCPSNVAVCDGEPVVLGSPTTADNCAVASVTNNAPGSYPVGTTTVTWTVTDDAGNTATCDQLVTVHANPTPTISGNTNICQGQAATLDAGSGYVSYAWTTGATTQTIMVNQAGTYGVSVVDNNGCEGYDEVEVMVTDSLMPVITGPAAICAGDTVTWDAGDGYASYLWSTGATTRFIEVSTAGTWSVTVTNTGGCSGSTSKTLTVHQTPVATVVLEMGETCAGNCDGQGGIDVSGGTAPYDYLWPDGETTPTVVGLCPGTYMVTVSDANGCSTTAMVSIDTGAPYPTATATNSGPVCEGEDVVLQGGGVGSYVWSGPNGFSSTEQSPMITNTSLADAGAYTLVVTNTVGCSDTAMTTLVVNADPVVTLPPTSVICAGESIVLDAGAGFTSYIWNTGATTSSILVDAAGSYSVTVTNTAGCMTADTTVVTEQSELDPVILSSQTVVCPGDTATLTVQSSYASYLWSTGDTTSSILVTTAGSYSVTVTNTTGCVGDTSIILLPGTPPNIFVSIMDVSCFGECNGMVMVDSFLGEGPISYLWSTGDTTDMIQDLCPGEYRVTATDADGCETVVITPIIEPDVLLIEVAMDSTVIITGGTTPYADTMIVRDGNWLFASVVDVNGCMAEDSILLTSTYDTEIEFALAVYPNPTSDLVFIDYAVGQFTDLQIIIVDMQGRSVATFKSKPMQISLGDLPSGIYHLQFIAREGVQTHRVVRIE